MNNVNSSFHNFEALLDIKNKKVLLYGDYRFH